MDTKLKNFIDRFKKYNSDATIFVNYAPSLLSLVDKVIVVDKGKIVGSGSVDALKATKSKKYKSLQKKPQVESVGI